MTNVKEGSHRHSFKTSGKYVLYCNDVKCNFIKDKKSKKVMELPQ